MERYINPEKIDFRLPYFEDDSGDALVPLRAVKRCVDETPSEDVVPREELDAMRGAANSYKMHYENARAEVAMEIFAELEGVLFTFKYPSLTALGKINVISAEGWHIRADDYSTIKKKYRRKMI